MDVVVYTLIGFTAFCGLLVSVGMFVREWRRFS